MRWPVGLEFLEHARVGPLYLVGDDIFAGLRPRTTVVIRRRGSLSAQTKAVAAGMRAQPSGVFSPSLEAREYLSVLAEFNFVSRQLLPYLRFLDTEDESRLDCPQELDAALEQLSRQAATLQGLLGPPPEAAVPPDLLTRLFPVPCAIMGDMVVPMERVALLGTTASDFAIQGGRYRLCPQGSTPLQGILAEVQKALTNLLLDQRRPDVRCNEAALTFCRDLDEVVRLLGLSPAGPDQPVYHDRYHRLYYARGHFVLARGPLPRRGAKETIFVGLAIQGKTRQQLLCVRPAVVDSAEKFWTPLGTPVTGGMCMGDRLQYHRLLSDQFTDAEATVHWLDAGVRIATGASGLPRQELRAPFPTRRSQSPKEASKRVGTHGLQAVLRSLGIR